jgi:hypothetical protein
MRDASFLQTKVPAIGAGRSIAPICCAVQFAVLMSCSPLKYYAGAFAFWASTCEQVCFAQQGADPRPEDPSLQLERDPSVLADVPEPKEGSEKQ